MLALTLLAVGATTTEPTVDAIAPFVQLGAIGALAILLMWFALGAYRRETARADKAEDQLRQLEKEMRDSVVPQLVRVAEVLGDVTTALRDRR